MRRQVGGMSSALSGGKSHTGQRAPGVDAAGIPRPRSPTHSRPGGSLYNQGPGMVPFPARTPDLVVLRTKHGGEYKVGYCFELTGKDNRRGSAHDTEEARVHGTVNALDVLIVDVHVWNVVFSVGFLLSAE